MTEVSLYEQAFFVLLFFLLTLHTRLPFEAALLSAITQRVVESFLAAVKHREAGRCVT